MNTFEHLQYIDKIKINNILSLCYHIDSNNGIMKFNFLTMALKVTLKYL